MKRPPCLARVSGFPSALFLLATLLAGLLPAPIAIAEQSGESLRANPEISVPPTSRLIDSNDPYLLQHAHNPVDWYPWGSEALEKARRENRPIFVSIGYSTCYWCHVDERTLYADPEIAKLMNEWFVNIKVDREQRPDLDRIYMTATQLLTGRGGWPNNVFLTPDLKPFYAGSYFPPTDEGSGRPGFPTVLGAIHDAWLHRRADLERRADLVHAAMQDVMRPSADGGAASIPPSTLRERARLAILAGFDGRNGGFGPGASPFGVLDVAGQVFEWTATADGAGRNIVKGGAWDDEGCGVCRPAAPGTLSSVSGSSVTPERHAWRGEPGGRRR